MPQVVRLIVPPTWARYRPNHMTPFFRGQLRLHGFCRRRLAFAGIAAGICLLAELLNHLHAETNPANPADVFALEAWTTEDGVPQNSITAVLQTRGGYIWASTYNGIAQFDGQRFKVFDSSNTKGLPNSRVTSLFEDPQGDIWIGHDTGDLTRFSDGVFQAFAYKSEWKSGTV